MLGFIRSIAFMKIIHTIIGFVLVGSVGYVLYATLADKVTPLTWIAYGLMIGEILILIRSGWKCPLTTYTEGLGAKVGAVTHLFLPQFLARRLFFFLKLFSFFCTGLLLYRVLA